MSESMQPVSNASHTNHPIPSQLCSECASVRRLNEPKHLCTRCTATDTTHANSSGMNVSAMPSMLPHVEISTAPPLAPLHILKPTSLSEPQLATLPALKIIPQSQQSYIGKLPHLHRFQPVQHQQQQQQQQHSQQTTATASSLNKPRPRHLMKLPEKNNLNPCVGCKSHKKRCDGARPMCGYCAKRRNVSECVYPSSVKRKSDSSPASETAPSPKRNQIESIQKQPYRSGQTHCAQSGGVTNHYHHSQQHIHQRGLRTPNQCHEYHEPQQRWNVHQSNVCIPAVTHIAPDTVPSLEKEQSIRKSNSSSSWMRNVLLHSDDEEDAVVGGAASAPRAAECCL
ncbi:hypothetical protein BJ741DRAFT_650280 [Chytriomyces cf. hyalinus JEL632]|nr:hypothetical protein BJ741DRAFT_650280 [Chytriomyces cf. hyalinus JEL632]